MKTQNSKPIPTFNHHPTPLHFHTPYLIHPIPYPSPPPTRSRYYNMDAYSKKQMMAAYMKGAEEVPGEMIEFNDEQKRR